jgi:hypothetical protein
MNTSTTTELMHAVLDGEATPEEVREFDLRLAGDAGARAEFAALRRMFDDLGRLPPRLPPEDLQARLLAQVNQPLAPPRVIGSSTLRDSFSKFISTLRHTFTADTYRNGADMKKIWIGAAVAVVAVVGVAQFMLGDKPASKDTMGTIVPADRYRGEQPTAGDVKVGSPTGTGTEQRPPARDGAQADSGGAKANSGTAAAAADSGGAKANSGTAAAAADSGGAKANSGTAAAAADSGGAKANSGTAAAAADSGGAKANSGTAAAAANSGGAKANSGTAAAAANSGGAKANQGAAAANSGAAANASVNKQ